MFFSSERQHFFKPLNSKYREQVVQCLCLLYQRLYSSNADYGSALGREQVLEILEEALARAPVLDAQDNEDETRFKNTREQANWTLKQLLDCGWLEKQVDTATMQSTFPFSRMGRLFTQPLVESDTTQIRTRHRNTRNTLNSLEAFLTRGEVYDLLDAFEYSERIVTDFTDIISELEERKRQLVQEVESQQLVQQATDQFFEFMEKRFQPDVSVRLSADSVEKHRDQIHKAIGKIRRKSSDSKRHMELQLRRLVPEIARNNHSALWFILDTIERRMSNAAEIMLPALRRALHSFTKRADIIIRQLSYLNSQPNNDLLQVCQQLQKLSPAEWDERMSRASEQLSGVKLQLIDPAQIKLLERRKTPPLSTAVNEEETPDPEALRESHIQQMLDQAFTINNQQVREYLVSALRAGRAISTAALPVDSAQDLLAVAQIVEVAAINNLSSEYAFRVEPTGRSTHSEFYAEQDEFIIELDNQQ